MYGIKLLGVGLYLVRMEFVLHLELDVEYKFFGWLEVKCVHVVEWLIIYSVLMDYIVYTGYGCTNNGYR